jgi:hypothetical protein
VLVLMALLVLLQTAAVFRLWFHFLSLVALAAVGLAVERAGTSHQRVACIRL